MSDTLDSLAREAAKTAPTIAKFARALGIPHAQAMAINQRLKLNVPIDPNESWQPLGELVREIADEALSTQQIPKAAE